MHTFTCFFVSLFLGVSCSDSVLLRLDGVEFVLILPLFFAYYRVICSLLFECGPQCFLLPFFIPLFSSSLCLSSSDCTCSRPLRTHTFWTGAFLSLSLFSSWPSSALLSLSLRFLAGYRRTRRVGDRSSTLPLHTQRDTNMREEGTCSMAAALGSCM